MTGILFLCTGNSCRSQMAEGFARRAAPPRVRVFSAGTKPAGVDLRATRVMAERGIDLSGHRSKDVSEIPVGELDLVVTLCGDAAEQCPTLLAAVRRVHWPLPDPAGASGDDDEVLAVFRNVRDDLERRVDDLLRSL